MEIPRTERLDFKIQVEDGIMHFYITDYVFKELATVREVPAEKYSAAIVRYNELVNGNRQRTKARG